MRRLACGPQGGNTGFTLIELLVALALLGLLATMSLGGIRVGARTWEIVTVKAESTGRAQMVRAFLSRELVQAMPVTFLASDGSERLAYVGESDSLTFAAPLAPHFGLGGVQRLRIAVVESEDGPGGGRQLVLFRRVFEAEEDFVADDPDRDEIHVLLDGIAEASFSYRAAGDDPGWADIWREEQEVPGLVRLDIAFGDAALGSWPSLVATRRITAASSCLIPTGMTPCGVR